MSTEYLGWGEHGVPENALSTEYRRCGKHEVPRMGERAWSTVDGVSAVPKMGRAQNIWFSEVAGVPFEQGVLGMGRAQSASDGESTE